MPTVPELVIMRRPPRPPEAAPIPSTAHFIWFGRELPWIHALALRSALERGEFERVVLHHDQPLAHVPAFAELRRHPRFEPRTIDLHDAFAPFGRLGLPLAAVYARQRRPAARANVLRAAILAREGGVYLDMDTVTLRSFAPLRSATLFCGEELVAFPASLWRERGPLALARALCLHGLRALCRRHAHGVELFQSVAGHYARALNNAVLGAAPEHPFLLALLERMVALPPARRLARFALGTHLLQALVAEQRPRDLVVHPPAVFYPLPPEISHHWFRLRERAALERVLQPETRAVHWYASVEQRALCARIDPEYVRRNQHAQLFSALAAPFAAR